MSTVQPNSRNEDITERDLFGSIPKALDLNPFEGINLDEIAVAPPRREISEDYEWIEINPIDDIDIEGINAVTPKGLEPDDGFEIVEINPIGEEHLCGLNELYPQTPSPSATESSAPAAQDVEGLTRKLKRLLFQRPVVSEQLARDVNPQPDVAAHESEPEIPAATPADPVAAHREMVKSKSKLFTQSLLGPFDSKSFSPLSRRLTQQSFNYAEIYQIREKIFAALDNQPHHIVMVASPCADSGNTFLVSVLGLNAASYTSLRILLLDMNLQQPQLHVPFELPLEKGFSDIAQGTVHWRDALKETDLPNLKLISAGSPLREPTRYLKNDFLVSFLQEVRTAFDMVLVDVPPTMVHDRNSIDPIALSKMSDLVIVMTRKKQTSRDTLLDMVQAIAREGGNIAGIVQIQ